MLSLLFLLLIGIPLLIFVGIGAWRLIRRSGSLKIMQGAALWLSGLVLISIFVFLGFLFGMR